MTTTAPRECFFPRGWRVIMTDEVDEYTPVSALDFPRRLPVMAPNPSFCLTSPSLSFVLHCFPVTIVPFSSALKVSEWISRLARCRLASWRSHLCLLFQCCLDVAWFISTSAPFGIPTLPFDVVPFRDVPLVEFMYLVFTRMPGDSYRRRIRSLLLYLCYLQGVSK